MDVGLYQDIMKNVGPSYYIYLRVFGCPLSRLFPGLLEGVQGSGSFPSCCIPPAYSIQQNIIKKLIILLECIAGPGYV